MAVERGHQLDREGIRTDRVKWNLSTAALYEEAVRKQEGSIAAEGPLVCRTGQHTGRSPNDKFVVREASSEAHIAWGKVNRPLEQAQWDALHHDFLQSLTDKEVYVLDCYAGADPAYRLPVRIITEYAWHNLFVRNLFIVDNKPSTPHVPQFTIIDSPKFQADPARHGTRSEVVIALNFAKKLVLIGGSLGSQMLDASGVRALAELPSLDALRARIAGMIATPATRVAGVLQGSAGQLARVFGAFARKNEEGEAAAAA